MNYLNLDESRLKIFHESRKRRVFVGELIYDKIKNRYVLRYDKTYTHAKDAIPLSPDLNLFKLCHVSQKGKLFHSFIDRIPDKHNPAYNDYCKAEGISPKEKSPIILLGTIGRRGPSNFVFELNYISKFHLSDFISFRKKLKITQNDIANAFDISKTTLQRMEAGISQDSNTLKQFEIMLTFPEVALWQLKQTGDRIHKNALMKLVNYFESKLSQDTIHSSQT